jgi:hypothetical protein
MPEGNPGSVYSRFDSTAGPGDDSSTFNFLQLDCAFLRIARIGAVAITLIIWALPLYNTSIGLVFPADFIALYVVAGLVSALELPFCCSFTPICRKVQAVLSPLEIYWARGVFYICLAATLILVNRFVTHAVDIWCWLLACGLLVVGVTYMLAYCNGERSSRVWEQEIMESGSFGEDSGGGFLAKLRAMLSGSNSKDVNGDLQRAALRAAMSTAM